MSSLETLIPQGYAYPSPNHRKFFAQLQPFAKTSPSLAKFLSAVEPLSLPALEELYTATFDLQASAPPYVGHYLYEVPEWRGLFLVELKNRMQKKGVDPGKELPDHLYWVLTYYARADREEQRVLWEEALRPALTKMAEALKETNNPFKHFIGFSLDFYSQKEA